MSVKLNAAQAALLVGHHERMVRWHVKRGSLPAKKAPTGVWEIDIRDLERVPGWRVDPARLTLLRGRDGAGASSGLVERLDAIERDVQSMSESFSVVVGWVRRSILGKSGEPSSESSALMEALGQQAPAASKTSPLQPGAISVVFRQRAEAGRWLSRHGVNEFTPKTWRGWREVPLESRAILEDAVARCDPGNWRITWRLHRCGDNMCVCHELLGDGAGRD